MGKLERIDLIVIHCSATKETQNYTFEQLERDHKLRGFRCAGYHYYIRRDGEKHIGRQLDEIGAHVGDLNHNWHSVGICYEGGLDSKGRPKDTRTDEQQAVIISTIFEVYAYIEKNLKQNLDKVRIVGHRDLSPDKDRDGVVEPHEWVKHCPCFDASEEYEDMLNMYKLLRKNAAI